MAESPINQARLYWCAVWDELLKHEPPGTTIGELINRERDHANAVRAKRAARDGSDPGKIRI